MAIHSETTIVPHESDFQTLKRWDVWSKRVFWALLICSVIAPIVSFFKLNGVESLIKISDFLSFILIPVFFILETVCDKYYVSAEYNRRKGYIDNSFDSKLTGTESKNYFSNDNLTPTFYKAAVNTFESCYFTERISRDMFGQIGFKNLAFFIFFLGIAYWGADRNPLVAPILQGLVSGYFLKECVDYYFFKERLQAILENFKTFFNGLIHKEFTATEVPIALKLIMDYEANLAHNKFQNTTPIYNKLKEQLLTGWTELKTYYKIK